MTSIKTDPWYLDREQSELWMPTGGNPACAYERAIASAGAVPGTGARPTYQYFVAHRGLVYVLFIDVPLAHPREVGSDSPADQNSAPLDSNRSAVSTQKLLMPAAKPAATETAVSPDGAPAITAAEQIDAVQDTLSLGISHIASILGVARATVHGWVRGDTPIPRDPRVAQRLRDLHRLGARWRMHSEHEIGRLLVAPLGDGEPSLYDLLRAEIWDSQRIDRALVLLADRVDARRSRAEREELQRKPETATEVQRHELRTLVQRGRFYGR